MSDYPTLPPPASPPPAWSGAPSPTSTSTLPTTPAATPAAPAAPPHRGRRGFAAAVVAASVLAGGAAGVGGAAAWSALDDEPATGGPAPAATSTAQVADAPDQPATDGSVQAVAAKVLPSVVKLDVTGGGQAGSGSGVILSEDGQILTNDHVVSFAEDDGSITVSFNDGSKTSATLLGTDPLTDTALIQAEDVSGLTPITVGKSANLEVGEPVVAVGSPFGLDATVTSGIVSALDRPVDVGSDGQGNSTTYPAIQTDAAINPGNSGGPLVDLAGNLVGINSSIRSTGSTTGAAAGSIGLGFAIPIDEVLPIVEQIKNGEKPTHARLGITVSDVRPEGEVGPGGGGLVVPDAPDSGVTTTDGAQVQEVSDGSAAGEAGLESGDVITRVDDHLITSADSLVATIRSYRPGEEVTVTFERDGEEQTTTLTLESDGGAARS